MTTSTKPKFLTVSEFADAIGVHEQTVRTWDNEDKLNAHHKTPSGRRLYTWTQVEAYFDGAYVTK